MGLDTSHDAWHGAYSAFARFRAGLARAAGMPGGPLRDWFERDAAPYLPISWDVLGPDPLIVLLDHSDCDGEIAAADCGPLADRIEELIPLLPGADDPGHIGSWAKKARQFVAGLRLAASRGEALDFH
jgi:hypothetical protein